MPATAAKNHPFPPADPPPELVSFFPTLAVPPKLSRLDLLGFIMMKAVKYSFWGSLGPALLAMYVLTLPGFAGGPPLILVFMAILGAGVLFGGGLGLLVALLGWLCYPMRSFWPYRIVVNALLLVGSLPLLRELDVSSPWSALTIVPMFFIWAFTNLAVAQAMIKVDAAPLPYRHHSPRLRSFRRASNQFQKLLYAMMPRSYPAVERLAGLGMLARWREALLGLVDLRPGMRVADLMSGAGQLRAGILRRVGAAGHLTMVDYVEGMLQRAPEGGPVRLLCESCLATSLPSASVDAVTCAFGVVALDAGEQDQLVGEIDRILAPNGVVGVLDLSLPRLAPLRWGYLLYLRTAVPLAGHLTQQLPLLYRLLPSYLRDFAGFEALARRFAAQGYTVSLAPLDGGLATALVAMKPGDEERGI